jgi:peptide deformylase
MKLPLCYYNNAVLRKMALPIEGISLEILKLAQDMVDTMVAANGVGLAAPQVGKLVRLFVIRDEVLAADGTVTLGAPEVMINPSLSKPSTEKVFMLEGCLSLPALYMEVMRPKTIHIRYQNLKGEWVEETLDNFRARVAMHENDHLNGVLIIDRVDRSERKKLEPRLAEIDKKYRVI